MVIALIAFAPSCGNPAPTCGCGEPADLTIPWRPLLLLGAALVLFYIADSAASSWSTIYLRDGLAASAALAPLAYGAYQTTSLLSRLAGDFLVRRNGAVNVVRVAGTVGTLGLLLVVLAPGPAVAIIGFAVLGAGLAVVAPLTFSAAGVLAGDGTPEQRRRKADALVARLNQFNYLGFVLGGVLTGLVSSGSSLRWGYVVPLVTTAMLVVLAPAFAPRRAGRGADDSLIGRGAVSRRVRGGAPGRPPGRTPASRPTRSGAPDPWFRPLRSRRRPTRREGSGAGEGVPIRVTVSTTRAGPRMPGSSRVARSVRSAPRPAPAISRGTWLRIRTAPPFSPVRPSTTVSRRHNADLPPRSNGLLRSVFAPSATTNGSPCHSSIRGRRRSR